MTDRLKPEGGLAVWVALRWYPVLLLTYACGISAVAASKYDNLAALLETPVPSERVSTQTPAACLRHLCIVIGEIHDPFKTMPGHQRNTHQGASTCTSYSNPCWMICCSSGAATRNFLTASRSYSRLFVQTNLRVNPTKYGGRPAALPGNTEAAYTRTNPSEG